MHNVGVVFRREIGAYFHSPIAYIFIIVFLLLTGGFYTNGFFLSGVSSMRDYFGTIPIYLVIFVPALTMRLWAEDQRLGTFELLMTLPMKPWHIVAGKYLASLAFYAISLACTLTIPLSLMWIGDPDLGVIVGGYLGALLAGGLFLAVGIFISGLFRDQIAAFILTLLACAFFVLAGTPFFVAILDGWIGGLGSFLSDAFAVSLRFEGIQRGVIGLDDIMFFLTFSITFLVLNTLSLEGRKY